MTDYKSQVLTCFCDDDQCPVCRFLAGSRDEADLLEVIEVMDKRLYEHEELLSAWLGVGGSKNPLNSK